MAALGFEVFRAMPIRGAIPRFHLADVQSSELRFGDNP